MRLPGFRSSADLIGRRLTLLALLRSVPAWILSASVLLLLIRAIVPAATALATGYLVGRLVSAGTQPGFGIVSLLPIVGWFVLPLLVGQLVDIGVEPLRFLVTRHVDGSHRRAVERFACAPTGIAHLEHPDLQEDLHQAAGDPDNWTERTPGPAAWSQLVLLSRALSGLLAVAVIGRDSVPVAVFLLAALVLFRAVQRRGFLAMVHAWVSGIRHRRRAVYWSSLLTEARPAKEARVFGFGDWVQDRYAAESHAHLEPFRAAKLIDTRRQWIGLLLVLGALAVTVYALGDLAMSATIVIGRLSADLTAAASLPALFSVSDATLDVEAGMARLLALRRLRDRVPATPTPLRDDAPLVATTPLVRFEHVRFRYPTGDRAVLDGFDLEVRPGEVLALVGLNGAGKTTIIKLLAGLYEPDAGRLTVDGVDLRDIPMHQWRRRISVVFQDFLRYELSIRDNLALGVPVPVGAEDIDAVSAQAGITDLVDGLPRRWETPLAPERSGGVDLSGGQWQRVALARALLAVRTGARVLVLDEPTANLDVRAEFDTFRQVIRAAGDASVVLISHRLSTVREADRIVLIESGRVAEAGTHETLLASGGRYASLFRLQAQAFASDGGDR